MGSALGTCASRTCRARLVSDDYTKPSAMREHRSAASRTPKLVSGIVGEGDHKERMVDRQRARVDYDQALKRLLTEAHDGFLSLIAPDVRWHRELSPALPAIDREADLVWEVTADDGSNGLVHVELQTAVESDIGERMAEYGVLLWRHYHLPVRSVLGNYSRRPCGRSEGGVTGWGRWRTLRPCRRYPTLRG